jgi:hypothetical protein
MVTRRKSAHSRFRRVKRRATQNAKRNRKQRNNVMRGGGKFEIYVIKNKNKPICFIVKKPVVFGKDDIYLMFDGDVSVADIKEIISNVAGIKNTLDSPLDSLVITAQPGTALNQTYIKLSGTTKYDTVSQEFITTNKADLLSGTFTKVEGISPTVTNWTDVTTNLEKNYKSNLGYTFYMLPPPNSPIPILSLIAMQNIILQTHKS